ncbi:MAG: prepilin-type N-terminal cleavage/methylation domain-containing protein [Candidatus Omnitrophica bacterium]|nr:prepilin-type N-terminal cleavage/methylation domain-containing protein [Candidatus Omnitrophota bacterium]
MIHHRRHVGGFTLTEVAVAIAVLIVIMTIALPQFTKMLMLRNEAATIEGLRTIVQACESWRSQGLAAGAPPSLAALAAAQPPYLDRRFQGASAGQPLFGYRWAYAAGRARQQAVGNINYAIQDRYAVRADPVQRGVTGQRSFYTDQTGVVRFELNGPAGPASTALEQAEN